jgi:ribosomal protein S18 acetylase RimI-like enzyme
MPVAPQLRKVQESDAEAVAALFRATYGEARKLDADEIRWWLRNEELDPDLLCVLEAGGRIVGYGDITVEDNEYVLDVAAPGCWETFFDWAEDAAREAGSERVRTQFPPDHEGAAVVQRRGYRRVQVSYTMEVAPDRPGSVELPQSVEVRGFREGVDDEQLRTLINDAFSQDTFHHEVSPTRFHEFFLKGRGYDPSFWFLAWSGDELVGFAVAFPERNGDTSLAWVSDLGVRSSWRRQGLGEALLRSVFREAHERGIPRVGLGVDVANPTGALRLYERVGMSPVSQFNSWVLDLS